MAEALSEYERERQANIAANRALLQQLNLGDGPASLGFQVINPPKGVKKKSVAGAKSKDSKPVAPRKASGTKRKAPEDEEEVTVTRKSTRLRRGVPVPINETPAEKRQREKLERERAAREEEERAEAVRKAILAKQPRHGPLELQQLLEDEETSEQAALMVELSDLCKGSYPRSLAKQRNPQPSNSQEKNKLRKILGGMEVTSRAKVTEDRVYSAAFHPEKTKDIIFFGDKHGQLGIWDAQAPTTTDADEDEAKEGGQYWRLQVHWPATSKSSISCIKFDPLDAHSVYTSAYDCTIRRTSFTSGISEEIYAVENTLISSFDFESNGKVLWISDTKGGVTHLDLRESRHAARRFQLSRREKIGCVSVNPANDWTLLASCNDKTIKLWDNRQLLAIPCPTLKEIPSVDIVDPRMTDYEEVTGWMDDENRAGTLRGSFTAGFAVSSAYWDASGRRIVSTSYDNKLRVWDVPSRQLATDAILESFEPQSTIKHDCKTGQWLTVFKAQWAPNPDVYPYFSVGDMDHSLKFFSADGDQLASVSDSTKITAVQAVTATHPSNVGRAATGNASGRCVLWTNDKDSF